MSGNREHAETISEGLKANGWYLTNAQYAALRAVVAENERLREALEEISVWPFTSASDAKHMQQIARDTLAAR